MPAADRATSAEIDPEAEVVLAESVGQALLIVLETLAPHERLAFVLHDMFDVPFDEIAAILSRSPAAVRHLASRGRRRVRGATGGDDIERRREVVGAFLAAARAGDFAGLLRLLAPDVKMEADAAAVRLGAPPLLRGARAGLGDAPLHPRPGADPGSHGTGLVRALALRAAADLSVCRQQSTSYVAGLEEVELSLVQPGLGAEVRAARAYASHAAAARCRRTRSSDGSVGLLPEGDRQGPEHLAVLHLLLSCPDQLSSILGGEPGLRLQHLADPSGGHSEVSRHERSGPAALLTDRHSDLSPHHSL